MRRGRNDHLGLRRTSQSIWGVATSVAPIGGYLSRADTTPCQSGKGTGRRPRYGTWRKRPYMCTGPGAAARDGVAATQGSTAINQSRRRWRHLFQREIDRWRVRARIRARAGRQSGGPGVRRDDSEAGAAGQCGPVWTLAWAASSGLRDGSRLGQKLQPGIVRRPAMVVFNNHRRRRAGLGQGRNGRAFGAARTTDVSKPVAPGEA